ncbi:hypothetical protein BDR04DRAFT_1039842, partial [Suillus decipiens]
QFGVRFNTVIMAFGAVPEVNRDLHQITMQLHTVLETCLGEDPSPAAPEMYQP